MQPGGRLLAPLARLRFVGAVCTPGRLPPGNFRELKTLQLLLLLVKLELVDDFFAAFYGIK